MRRGSAVSFAIAIVCAAAATLLLRVMIPGNGGEADVQTIVVAARPLGFGVPLTADNLREVSWPAKEPIAGGFASIQELTRAGRRLSLTPLQRNEPILATKVTGPDQRATLSTQIDEGMRAVTVRVDEVRGVAGFILPGDHVDVVLTRGESGGQDSSAYADFLLQNIKVLAVDQLANERQDKPSVARAVTLELTPPQAQRVILAQGIGHLSLILRQAGEPEMAATPRVTSADLGDKVASAPAGGGTGELQARLDEVRRSLEEKNAQRLGELETRLRNEMAMNSARIVAPAPALAPPSLGSLNPVVSVTRNGSKREQYTVTTER